MLSYNTQTLMEENQNFGNWNKASRIDVPVPKQKRFLARKIHKLKKILKSGSKSLAEHFSFEQRKNAQNEELEHRQNYENEELERKFRSANVCRYEVDENTANENWENWDSCYLCAGQTNFYHCQQPQPQLGYNCDSVCYVFMPGQTKPVSVKLRTAKIPGGVMWISYRPDVDIHPDHNLYSFTSSQIPQGQHPIVV